MTNTADIETITRLDRSGRVHEFSVSHEPQSRFGPWVAYDHQGRMVVAVPTREHLIEQLEIYLDIRDAVASS